MTARKTALIATDPNKEFVDEGYPLTSAHRGLKDELKCMAAEIRTAADRPNEIVIVTQDCHPDKEGKHDQAIRDILTPVKGAAAAEERIAKAHASYREEREQFPEHCEYGSESWKLNDEVQAAIDYMMAKAPDRIFLIQKYAYHIRTGIVVNGGFKGFTFAELDAALGIEQYRLCGYVTHICVHGGAESVVELGKDVILEERMTNSFAQDKHDEGIAMIAALDGVNGARVTINRCPKVA